MERKCHEGNESASLRVQKDKHFLFRLSKRRERISSDGSDNSGKKKHFVQLKKGYQIFPSKMIDFAVSL